MTIHFVKDLEIIRGNPTLTRLDGEERCTLESITGREELFGVYLVDVIAPDGKYHAGAFVGTPPVPVFEDIPEVPIEVRRAGMIISPMQGILTLGETEWNKILTYRETATWQEKIIIDSAQDWNRTSQNIQFFGYLLNYTDEQMDTMFITAAQVVV